MAWEPLSIRHGNPAPPADELTCIERLVSDPDPPGVLPWVGLLAPDDLRRLREDLALLLAEPDQTHEPLDWNEVLDTLAEYAELAGWNGCLIPLPSSATMEELPLYRVDVRRRDLRTLGSACPTTRAAAVEILEEFLPRWPTASARLKKGSLKKLENRDIWQISLPDGYRLRYYLDESTRTAFVVYMGPHPDGEENGREQAVRAAVQRRLKRAT